MSCSDVEVWAAMRYTLCRGCICELQKRRDFSAMRYTLCRGWICELQRRRHFSAMRYTLCRGCICELQSRRERDPTNHESLSCCTNSTTLEECILSSLRTKGQSNSAYTGLAMSAVYRECALRLQGSSMFKTFPVCTPLFKQVHQSQAQQTARLQAQLDDAQSRLRESELASCQIQAQLQCKVVWHSIFSTL